MKGIKIMSKTILYAYKDTESFIKDINKMRLANKNKWFLFQGVVNFKTVQVKCYNAWLQIYKVNYAGLMDINVKDFKEALRRGVK